MGALVGSGLTLAELRGTHLGRGARPRGPGARRGRSGSGPAGSGWRCVGGLAGLAVTQTGVGLTGLLLSLTLVPVAVILAGLRAARAA